jgi:hypothetical protein
MRRDASRIAYQLSGFILISLALFLSACSSVYPPVPVVPAKQPLPYSATLILTHVGAFTVQPGATMIVDPVVANYVTDVSKGLGARTEWEESILRYLQARKTFLRVETSGRSDVELVMQVNVYIDPSVHHFKPIYLARLDAAIRDPRTHVILVAYTGQGKAYGRGPDDGQRHDEGPMHQAVQAGLHDLFGKMEHDTRMRRLGTE